jgi:hypothetical protein
MPAIDSFLTAGKVTWQVKNTGKDIRQVKKKTMPGFFYNSGI